MRMVSGNRRSNAQILRMRTGSTGLFRKCQGGFQHAQIADVVGENEHEPRIQRRTLGVRQSAMRIDQRFIRSIGVCKAELGFRARS